MTNSDEFAKCEFCLRPIHEADQYGVSADGVYTCEDHAPTLADAINQHEEIMRTVPWRQGGAWI